MSDPSPDVTILVPALDEEQTIRELVDRLLALPISKQIIVMNNGSTDRTGEILAGFGDAIETITFQDKTGKGASIRAALPKVIGKTVVIQDADLEYVPEELPRLVQPILSGKADVVYGTRFLNGMPAEMALPNKIVNRLLAWAVRILFGKKITDEATCYKAFRTDVLAKMRLECNRFEFCPEVTAKSIRMGHEILEVPISYSPRSKLAGKKIRWTDAPEAFWTLLKYRSWRV
ncbi:MAG: glycosyltransferase family 2 protein [Armatimonadetes bacterium]|nr:glycosyltransferase family 2 protein [Armatimonadota bacterium]